MRRRRPTRIRKSRIEQLEHRRLLAADGLSLVADSVEVEQNSAAIRMEVLENDAFDNDYAGDRRITAVSTGSLGGRIEIDGDGGSLLYTPPADSVGEEVFHYTVDGTTSADVAVRIVSPLSPFLATIYLFRDDYQLDLLADARFSGDYAGEKRITLISETALGADVRISEDGQSVIYRSRIGTEGQDRFTYIVDDRFVATAMVQVINPLEPDRYEVLQRSGQTKLNVLSNDFRSGSDPDVRPHADSHPGENHSCSRTTAITSKLKIADDGRSIDFLPGEEFSGYGVTFRYVVDGRYEETAHVTVHRPVQDDFEIADVDGGVHTFDVLANDQYRSIFQPDDSCGSIASLP